MRHLLLQAILCTVLFCVASSTSWAQGIATLEGNCSNPIAMKSQRPRTIFKLFDADDEVTYFVEDGWLYIDFPINEGLATVSIIAADDHREAWRPCGTWKRFVYYIGQAETTLYITVKTSLGCAYTGVINPQPVYDDETDW